MDPRVLFFPIGVLNSTANCGQACGKCQEQCVCVALPHNGRRRRSAECHLSPPSGDDEGENKVLCTLCDARADRQSMLRKRNLLSGDLVRHSPSPKSVSHREHLKQGWDDDDDDDQDPHIIPAAESQFDEAPALRDAAPLRREMSKIGVASPSLSLLCTSESTTSLREGESVRRQGKGVFSAESSLRGEPQQTYHNPHHIYRGLRGGGPRPTVRERGNEDRNRGENVPSSPVRRSISATRLRRREGRRKPPQPPPPSLRGGIRERGECGEGRGKSLWRLASCLRCRTLFLFLSHVNYLSVCLSTVGDSPKVFIRPTFLFERGKTDHRSPNRRLCFSAKCLQSQQR